MVKLRGSTFQQAGLSVSPGQWIRVQIPSDRWPLQMQIGRGSAKPAFLDRDPNGTVYAQLRCPELPPGNYPVVVSTPDTVIETSITVS